MQTHVLDIVWYALDGLAAQIVGCEVVGHVQRDEGAVPDSYQHMIPLNSRLHRRPHMTAIFCALATKAAK